jgi:hypothetical protein
LKITKLPAGPVDPDLFFDRYQHDNAGLSSHVTRSEALASRDFAAPMFADGRHKRSKKQAE